MKQCLKCGEFNSDSMSFCVECGTALPPVAGAMPLDPNSAPTIAAGIETQTVVANRNPQPFYEAPKKSNTLKIVLIGGIAVVLLGIGIVVVAAVGLIMLAPSVNENRAATPRPPQNTKPLVDKNPGQKPTPEVSFTPPAEPTKNGTFTVYADRGWQLSDIDTVPLEEFTTTVQGKINISGVKSGVTFAGVNDAKSKSRRLFDEYPTGALLMRTRYADGNTSNIALVSASGPIGYWQNYPEERGKIEFCINDNAPESNSGQFTVTKKFTTIGKKKN